MKQVFALISALVLTTALFTGCGCRNTQPAVTTAPATMPTLVTTETTLPVPATTRPTVSPTIEDGNGPVEDPTVTEDTGAAGRTRKSDMG